MWTYIIAGIVALCAIATIVGEVKSYLSGVKESGKIECRLDYAKAAEKRRATEVAASTSAAKGLASDRAEAKGQVKTRTVYVEKILEKPIYSNVCFDPAGLSCINAVVSGAKSSDGCKSDGTVPSAGTVK